MRIRYVVSTMVFWWREDHLSLELECDFLRSQGFGVELWPTIKGNDDCRYIRRNWDRLKLATDGMVVSLHSRDDGPTMKEWDEQLECAKYLNANMVVDLGSLCVCEGLGIADWGFATDVIKMAEAKGVRLCIETGSLPVLVEMGKKFDSIWYCLDAGFANIDPDNSFSDYVDQLAERTGHLHLADNYGKLADHEPPGVRGGMDRENWDILLAGLGKYDNDVIGSFEMSPCMPGTMVEQGSKFIFDIVGFPDRPKVQPGSEGVDYRPH